MHFLDNGIDEVLQAELELLQVFRPLIITDETVPNDDLLDECLEGIAAASAERAVSKLVKQEVSLRANHMEARKIANRAFKEGRDGLIAMGRRGAIDTCKFASRELARVRFEPKLQGQGLPMIVLPASPSDGAGLRSTIRIVDKSGTYHTYQDENFSPSTLICDLRFYDALENLEATCAVVDVFVHCLEILSRARFNPPSKGMALDGLRRAWRILQQTAVGTFEQSHRRDIYSASVNAALSEDGGLGAIHALSLAIEEDQKSFYPHGYFHTAVFAPLMLFNAPALAPVVGDIEDAIGCSGGVEGIISSVGVVSKKLGLPTSMKSLKLEQSARARIAASVSVDVASTTNPRRVGKADYEAILVGN